ncbi:MAG: hypothetical protein HZA89_11150 [Verrucomicrobia bacterium]|nr:hypothetical protein [Verrucomicrobiota bacterium]
MTQPLAFLVYEQLMPGSQLTNRLKDLGYRVHTLSDAAALVGEAEKEKPLVVIVDLASSTTDVNAVIQRLKANSATAHLPVLAFTTKSDQAVSDAAVAAGATLVAGSEAILAQLPQLLDQVLDS